MKKNFKRSVDRNIESKKTKPWHNISIEQVVESLGADIKYGLSEEEANGRRKKYGLNRLPEEKSLSGLQIFLEQFKSPMIYILLLAGVITLFFHEYTDSAVILAAVVLNTIIGYFQESKASRALSELKKVLKVKALVIRDGHEKEVLQEQLVPGDVIILKPGFKVPADARLIEANGLKVNESILTGEWMPAEKRTDVLPENTPVVDRDSMVYMGTVVETGEGKAIVTGTGLETEIGNVAQLVRETKEEKTPYQKKLSKFSKTIGIIIAVICVFIFVEGVVTGGEVEEMFITSVAVAVAAIPEGLPIAMTVILALGMQRILKRKGLVRKLASAETLGSTSVICTDKTGTLTEAKMEVSIISTLTRDVLCKAGKYSEKIDKSSKASHVLALKIAVSCVDAFVENPEAPKNKWVFRGRPTDRALLKAGMQAGISKEFIEEETPKVAELPFDPVTKYSATLNRLSKNRHVVYVLGAPEVILSMSKYMYLDSKQKKLIKPRLKELTRKYEKMTNNGMRVLATAYKRIDKKSKKLSKSSNSGITFNEKDLKDLVFVGFIGLEDPIRESVKEAIKICKKAGMKPIIITGDNKLTAKAVAEKIGLKIGDKNIIEGHELEKMSDKEFKKRVKDIRIYARTSPVQKLRIVKALQERGEVVAMTGDGINDAPALKQADIGVALGSGTDVAKEVADLVLLKDDFSVIVAAVEEGRAIIDNVRKAITYLLASSFTEIILIGGSIIAGFPLPITASQILWINLIEDGLPNISLTFEPKEKDIMNNKPEPHHAPLLTREMKTIIFLIGIVTDFILLGLFFWLWEHLGHDLAHVRTMVFACLAIDSLFYIFSCKSLRKSIWNIDIFSNKILLVACSVGFTMLVLAIYVPLFQLLLKTVPLTIEDWAIVFALGILEISLIELTKWHFIKSGKFN